MALVAFGVLAIALLAAIIAVRMRKTGPMAVDRFAQERALLKAEKVTLEKQLEAADAQETSLITGELRRRALALAKLEERSGGLSAQSVPAALPIVASSLVLAAALYMVQSNGFGLSTSAANGGDSDRARSVTSQRGADPSLSVEELMALGQMRFRGGDPRGAFDAYQAASKKTPDALGPWIAQGEALIAAERGRLSPAALLAFTEADRVSPGNPISRYYAGLERFQQNDPAAAKTIWADIAARSTPDAPWMSQVQRGLQEADIALGLSQEPQRPQMTAEQIKGMVAGLAARLDDAPDDPEGWLMLARSYLVLGQEEEARSALMRLRALSQVPPDVLAEAQILAAQLPDLADER